MKQTVQILTSDPIVAPLAQMALMDEGLETMVEWVRSRVPACVPEEYDQHGKNEPRWMTLFPHDGTEAITGTDIKRPISHNELLVELAGRKCYNSFGAKAGKKSNSEYIANTQGGDVPHASILYHPKMSFFIAGVSRRVSHELIRHYVGADRDEEGSPSQESTRYVEHAGFYVAHPRIIDPMLLPSSLDANELGEFTRAMECNYGEYLDYIARQTGYHCAMFGEEPRGMHRKRIFESASPYLSHACETSWIWTTNPIALAKMARERDNEGADLEYRRLMRKWKKVAVQHWPNLFPQPWMHT